MRTPKKTARERVFEFILANPGHRSDEIARATGIPEPTVTSSVSVLRSEGAVRGELHMPKPGFGGPFNRWFALSPEEQEDEAPPIRRRVPAGEWQPHAIAVRSVFDLGAQA